MRICVCIKQVPATNEAKIDPVSHTIIRESVDAILNPFDAFAVEAALRLRARCGGTVTALTMGLPSAEKTLRGVVAVGADAGVLLTDRAFAGADTLATAYALACGVKKMGGADLIVCGRQASDGDTAQVGPMLAEALELPHVADVAAIEEISDGAVTLRRLTDEGYLRVQVACPALITVCKEIAVPRLPSVAGVLRGDAANITVWSAADVAADPEKIGLRGSRTRVVQTQRPDRAVKTQYLTGTPNEQAKTLLARLRASQVVGGQCHAAD